MFQLTAAAATATATAASATAATAATTVADFTADNVVAGILYLLLSTAVFLFSVRGSDFFTRLQPAVLEEKDTKKKEVFKLVEKV